MAINQILNVPDWRQLSSATASLPASSYTKLLPVTDNYWYGLDSTGRVRKIGYEKQYYAGFSQSSLSSPSTSDSRVDVNIGAGLAFTSGAQYSQIVVSGVTMGNLNISNPYSSGFVLGLNSTASGQFEWVGVSGSVISGSTNSLARFIAPNALGDSIISDDGSQAYIGSISALSGVSFSVTGDVQVDDTIYFGANTNRFIGRTNTSDIDIQTTGNFRVSAYTNSSYKVIESLNDSTPSKSIQFFGGTTSTGLVSMNINNQLPSVLVGVNSNSPTFSAFSVTYSVALGLSGGSLQIKDGSEGQYKVLVSSTTQGHGIWATMVGLNNGGSIYNTPTNIRIPIYQNVGSFELDDRLGGPSISDSATVFGLTYYRQYTYSLTIASQSLPSRDWNNIGWGSTYSGTPSVFDVVFEIPNTNFTYSQFLMSRGNQIKYGSLFLYDPTEVFGGNRDEYSSSGIFGKDLSNTVLGPYSSNGDYAWRPGNRHNSIEYYLNSDKTQGLFKYGWLFPEYNFDKPLGYTTSIAQSETLGTLFWPRAIYHERLTWNTPTDFLTGGTISATQGQPDRFKTLNSTPAGRFTPAKRSGQLDIQVVRRNSNILYNNLVRDKFINILYNYEYSRMAYTASLTQSFVRLDTVTSHYLKLESGEFTGSITQSTVLFVNPQFGSFTSSGVLTMSLARQVGIHVSQEVGIGRTQPIGTVKEAHDFISGRISNGNTESNIETHVGFLAQSKLIGNQWNPIGRKAFQTDLNFAVVSNWPTYSLYRTNKPWGFFAEKDKSNFGGGLMINIGATFGTSLGGYLDIQGLTGIYNPSAVSALNTFDLDGSPISIPTLSWSTILPQVYLRPSAIGLSPSGLTDGFMWYTPGELNFYDGNQTINLLNTSSTTVAGGLTGTGTTNYVPVWNSTKELSSLSPIFVQSGNGNVGIQVVNPSYSLQIKTYSGSTTIALGLSGGFIYHDGSQGTTGSVMMTDATGKAYLYPLILPAPGITASVARVSGSYGSGYLPLYVGEGKTSGPSGSSEYQIGPILTDNLGSDLSLLIEPQVQFQANNPAATNRNMTLVVPSLVNTVPSGLTVSVDFLMDYGDQTVYGQKTFHKSVFIGPTSGGNNGIFLYDSDTNYSGFIGPTSIPTNIVYRLPATAFSDGYLKISSVNGNTYSLTWATVSASGAGTQGPIGPAGAAGAAGVAGPAGTAGTPGGIGADGPQGRTGPTGSQGPTGPRGATGATGVVSIGVFSESNFYPHGATLSSTGVLTLGAAGTAGPGLVHTGSQTFSGDKYFQGDVFIGPTNGNGIFLFDGSGLTYSGFVGPTGLSTNLIYRLPPTVSLDRYLKTCTNDGVNWNLVWATASAPASGLAIPTNEILFGNNTGVSSDSHFTFNPSTCDFIVSSTPSNTPTPSGISINSIIGGNNQTLICTVKSSIIGGEFNTISDGDCSLITTSRASSICPGLSTGATIKSGVIIGGDNNQIIGSGSNFASIINGNNQSILGTNSNNSSILGGISNEINRFSETSTIIGGDNNIIFHAKCSAIISSRNSSICLNPNATSANTLESSIIIGGLTNVIFGTSSTFTTILNGNNQCISGCGSNNSAIIAGDGHLIGTASNNSVLIGGSGHKLGTSSNSVILGGSGLVLNNTPNTVYVPQLMINSVTEAPTQTQILMWSTSDKKVYWRNVSSLPSSPGGGGATLSLVGFNIGTFSSTSEIQSGGNIFGATISYSNGFGNLTFSAASSQNPGMVSTTTQSFIGQKQFLNSVFIGSSTGTQSTGLFIYDNSTYSRYTGFLSPATVSNTFVYQLPGVTGSLNQFLTITSVTSSGDFTTFSTSWSYPQAGTGLTVSNTGVINLTNITPNTIIMYPGTFSGTYFTVSTADNGKLLDINTGGQVIYIDAPGVTQSYFNNNIGDRGFEFRVRKVDSSQGIVAVNIPEIGGTANSAIGFPFVHITRQNQIYEFKYNYASASWASYQVDMGYISPNTFVGNLTGVTGYGEEYEFVDYSDTVQKALNYNGGGFNNDWLSGVIYSSVNALNVSTNLINNPLSLLNVNSGQFIGLSAAGSSGLTIPGFSLIRGKNLRVYLAGTYSKTNSGGISGFEMRFLLGGKTINSRTYSVPGNSSGSFEIDYNLKVRNGGLSGSVYGTGKMIFDEFSSPGAPIYLIHSYTQSLATDINLSSNATFDIQANQSTNTNLSFTVLSSIIERLG